MTEESKQTKPVKAPAANWQYSSDESGASPAPLPNPGSAKGDSVSWTASEFIAHRKNVGWYATVALVTVIVTALVFVLTHDRISTVMIIIVGILFCLGAARKPRVLSYKLDNDGLTIGDRLHPYGEFRSFTMLRDGPFANIELLPFKRLMPQTSIYCSPEDEDEIVDMISQHVPYEQRPNSFVDRFTRHIRF